MNKFLVLLVFLLASCATKPLSPTELVDKSMTAAKEGDAETRWEIASKSSKEKMLKGKTKEQALKDLKGEAFMYQFVKSWKSTIVHQTEDKASIRIDYKFYDPHSKKVIDQKSDLTLVKEEGIWKVD